MATTINKQRLLTQFFAASQESGEEPEQEAAAGA